MVVVNGGIVSVVISMMCFYRVGVNQATSSDVGGEVHSCRGGQLMWWENSSAWRLAAYLWIILKPDGRGDVDDSYLQKSRSDLWCLLSGISPEPEPE